MTVSGPGLKKQDSHSSIHEAALNEARELRDIIQKCLTDNQKEKAIQVAEITIEHWESRTLQHAESEEEGLYKEMVEEDPGLTELVIQLTRDHTIMRKIVGQMKELLLSQEVDERFIKLIDGLILVDEIHNEEEMNNLLTHSE